MVLYVAYAGTRRDTHGRMRILRAGGGSRRTGDPETGGAGIAGCDSQSGHSVDTLPRYTPGDCEGCGGGAERGNGSVEGDGGVEGEGVKPPPYTFDAGALVAEEDGDGDVGGGPHGVGHNGLPVALDQVHGPRLERVS